MKFEFVVSREDLERAIYVASKRLRIGESRTTEKEEPTREKPVEERGFGPYEP